MELLYSYQIFLLTYKKKEFICTQRKQIEVKYDLVVKYIDSMSGKELAFKVNKKLTGSHISKKILLKSFFFLFFNDDLIGETWPNVWKPSVRVRDQPTGDSKWHPTNELLKGIALLPNWLNWRGLLQLTNLGAEGSTKSFIDLYFFNDRTLLFP